MEFYCRICEKKICDRVRYNPKDDPVDRHMAGHEEKLERAPWEGDYVCGKCKYPHRSAKALENHVRGCKQEKNARLFSRRDHMQGEDKETENIQDPMKKIENPQTRDRQGSNTNTPANVMKTQRPTTERGFECLFISSGIGAWYTDEVIIWAMKKMTNLHLLNQPDGPV